MPVEVILWIIGAFITMLCGLLATLWAMVRSEQKAQDEAIRTKADKTAISEAQVRHDREFDRIREEQSRMMDKADERHQRDLSAMESRLSSKIDMVLEFLKKERS